MKIYVAHSKKLNYQDELYKPLRESRLNNQHEIVLPHEFSDEPFNSKEFLKSCNAMIAEVTYTGTGLGIEIGWADALNVPLIGIYRKGMKLSGSVKATIDNISEYEGVDDLVKTIEDQLKLL